MLTSSSQIILSISVPKLYELRQNIVKRHNKQTSVIISEHMLRFEIMMMIMLMLEVEVGVF